MDYRQKLKITRMTAVRDDIDSSGAPGKLKLGTVNMESVLLVITLGYPGDLTGQVIGTSLALADFPKLDQVVTAQGKCTAAVVTNGDDEDIVYDLSVGLTAAAAPAWQVGVAYVAGQFVTNGSSQYKCLVAGTAGIGIGPTGLGNQIPDGTTVWEWHCYANADIQVTSIDFVPGMLVDANAIIINHF